MLTLRKNSGKEQSTSSSPAKNCLYSTESGTCSSMECTRRRRSPKLSTSPRSTPQMDRPCARRPSVCTGAVCLPSSLAAAWRASMMPSGERLDVTLQLCLPSPGITLPGFSGDQPICDASRTLAPSSRAKYRSESLPGIATNGWNAAAPISRKGALLLPCSSSLRRLRITAQSPRLSVMAQTSLTRLELSSEICAAAAARKLSAASRTPSGSTTRNWPPPPDPSRTRANPSSASSARGRTSQSRVIHCDLPARRSSPAERTHRPSAAPAKRNSSVPRILPSSGVRSGIELLKSLREPPALAQSAENYGESPRLGRVMANLRIWMAAPLIAVGAWAAGPQAAATHPRPAAAVTPKRVTVQPKLSDAQLETVIRAKFAKSKINADGFTVRVQGGVATVD